MDYSYSSFKPGSILIFSKPGQIGEHPPEYYGLFSLLANDRYLLELRPEASGRQHS
jgi:hypothetical protein